MGGSYIIWSVVAVLSWGICPILDRLSLLKVSPTLALFVQSAVITAALAFSIYLNPSKGKVDVSSMEWSTIAILIAAALIGGLVGEYAYLKAISGSGAAKAVSLTSVYPLVTLVLSIAILGEKITMTGCAGIALVTIGVGLLSSSAGGA